MLTDEIIAGFVALAGPDYSWAGVRGCSRPASDVRRALRADLLARQGNICPVGGETLTDADAIEFNHVVARGNGVRGFIPGNVFAGCAAHNAMTKPQHDHNGRVVSGKAVLWTADLARPDVVPLEWTPFPILRRSL